MANRAQKRKLEKDKSKTKKLRLEKKSFLKDTLELNDEMASFVKTLIIVVSVFLVVLGITLIFNRIGIFNKGYTEPVKGETKISYEEILIGSVFNRQDAEYYVFLGDYTDRTNNFYLISKLESYTGSIPLYKVDMTKGINKNYISEYGNSSARNADELKIKAPTLIKISNGNNILYLEGVENIVNELFK